MKDIEYSVAIRTLGTAGEKYKKLLDSIKNSNLQPKKIYVVLPEGYNPPEYKLGNETFIYSKKGMVAQRLKALDFVDTEYTLFCDDDVEFESDFVEKLLDPLEKGKYSCSSGPLLEFFPPKSLKYILASLLGGACPMIRGKETTYTRILSTGGWSYNRDIDFSLHKFYNADSLAWTCFMINTQSFREISFENEKIWLEKSGYAAYDDQTMFYKLISKGLKVCVVSDAIYIHNDGKTSTKTLKLEPIYAGSFNHYIFWHRFLYLPCKSKLKKLWLKICINYYIFMSKIYNGLPAIIYVNNKEKAIASSKGFKDAKKYVKSEEYLSLPKIN